MWVSLGIVAMWLAVSGSNPVAPLSNAAANGGPARSRSGTFVERSGGNRW
jgi:hypothetical protein